jgi:hypothetical protein
VLLSEGVGECFATLESLTQCRFSSSIFTHHLVPLLHTLSVAIEVSHVIVLSLFIFTKPLMAMAMAM